ncbi:hypothetical protein [uncultured Tateyamaria sp.]|uniref:hypothetical protein n=1 Tax=uncultured Tateyamaria sp. TaxID=455651 RepID=UPI0026148F22|nr:hypothetical protein [uncultured Tateyamaria sp.]
MAISVRGEAATDGPSGMIQSFFDRCVTPTASHWEPDISGLLSVKGAELKSLLTERPRLASKGSYFANPEATWVLQTDYGPGRPTCTVFTLDAAVSQVIDVWCAKVDELEAKGWQEFALVPTELGLQNRGSLVGSVKYRDGDDITIWMRLERGQRKNYAMMMVTVGHVGSHAFEKYPGECR